MIDRSKSFLSSVRENWMILAFIAQLIIWFSVNNTDHKSYEARLTNLEARQEQLDITSNEIKVRLASIDTTLMFIKERVK